MCAEQPILYRYNVSASGHARTRGGLFGSLTGLALLWSARARQRRALEFLDDRLLRDIGVGGIEAALEARKPFWRA